MDRRLRQFPEDFVLRDGVHEFRLSEAQASPATPLDQYISDVVERASDRSLFSSELTRAIRDHTTRFHLSPQRANLLHPLSHLKGKRILEVCAGYGGLTRYLAEIAREVVSVESNVQRARIAAKRVTDRSNTIILADRIENLGTTATYDIVTVIDALEGTAFTDSSLVELLGHAQRHLSGDGILILAVNNKIGLKFFAGARENVADQPFGGLNDSQIGCGRVELRRILQKAGLPHQAWFYPFPDHKFPSVILSAPFVAQHLNAASNLVMESVHLDSQRPANSAFSLEQAWVSIARNGLLEDLANSFLVVCSSSESALVPYLSDHAWRYSTNRGSAHPSEFVFKEIDGQIAVDRRLLRDSALTPQPFRRLESAYSDDDNWWTVLSAVVNRPGWSLAAVADWARVWTEALAQISGLTWPQDFQTKVDGNFLEAMPFNLLHGSDQKSRFINLDGQFGSPVELGYVIFRGLHESLFRVSSFAQPVVGTPLVTHDIVLGVMGVLGLSLSPTDIDRYASAEAQLNAPARGSNAATAPSIRSRWHIPIPQRVGADRDVIAFEARALRNEAEKLKQRLTIAEGAQQLLRNEVIAIRQIADDRAEKLNQLRNGIYDPQLESRLTTIIAERDTALAAAQEQHNTTITALRLEADQQVSRVQSELQSARTYLRESQTLTQDLSGRLALAEEELARKSAKTEHLATENEALARDVDDSRKLIETLKVALGEAHCATSDRAAQVEQLRLLFAEAESASKALAAEHESNITSVIAENARAITAMSVDYQTTLDLLRQEAAARDTNFSKELEATRNERDAARRAAETLKDEFQATAAHRDALQEEVTQIIQVLQDERTTYQKQLDELERQRIEWTDQNNTLKSDVQATGAALREREIAIRALTAARDQASDRIDRFSAESKLASDQIALLQERVAILQPEHEAQRDRADRAESGAAVLRLQLGSERQALARNAIAQEKLVKDTKAAKEQLDRLRTTIEEQTRRLEELAPGAPLAKALRLFKRSPSLYATNDLSLSKPRQIDIIRESRLFSPMYYLRRYPDVAETGIDPVLHYVHKGSAEGRWPHPLFDGSYYLDQMHKFGATDVAALAHYIVQGAALGLNPHPLFKSDWYLHNNPDVATAGGNPLQHYIAHGWLEGRDPHPLFDTSQYVELHGRERNSRENPLIAFLNQAVLPPPQPDGSRGTKPARFQPHPLFSIELYLQQNPDVAEAKVNPLYHYLSTGWREGRNPHPLFASLHYRKQSNIADSDEPLIHYVLKGASEGHAPHPLFNVPHYLLQVSTPDALKDPLGHYLTSGASNSLDPHPLFDTKWYLQNNADVVKSGINPLVHYVMHGWKEQRNPHRLFDVAFYQKQNPDVVTEPLLHFDEVGWKEGRDPNPEFSTSRYLRDHPEVAELSLNPLSHFLARPLIYRR